jgi:hypothetical protein
MGGKGCADKQEEAAVIGRDRREKLKWDRLQQRKMLGE